MADKAFESFGRLMDISFVVVTYNSSKTILQTLESIRFQIVKYAHDTTVELIVADDGSVDDTQLLIKRFLEENNSLFENTKLLFSDVNRGTCKNICEAFRNSEGEHIFAIAGDDLLSNYNVIDELMHVKPDEIVICPRLRFENDKLIKDKKLYIGDVLTSFKRERTISEDAYYTCPIPNGSMVGRNFFNENRYAFTEKFSLLDDRVGYFEILKNNDFTVRASYTPILLYRISSLQVTKSAGLAKQLICDDVRKLTEYALKETINPIKRFKIRISCFKETNFALYKKIWFICDPTEYFKILNYKINKKRTFKIINKIISDAEKYRVDEYIDLINHNAEEYRYQ